MAHPETVCEGLQHRVYDAVELHALVEELAYLEEKRELLDFPVI
jgi:hypothetical protein